MTSTNYIYTPDLIGEVVAKTELLTSSDASLVKLFGVSLVYEYGTLFELQKRIAIKDRRTQSVQKYPLVWLVWERPENLKRYRGGFSNKSYIISPLIFIIARTDVDYTSIQRNENIFKPVLLPIYENFLKALRMHRNFNTGNTIEHDEYEHYFWGMNNEGKTVLSDYNDAIELKLIDLEVLQKC